MPACAQWGSVGDVAASRHSVLRRTQAVELGLSPKVIRRLKSAGVLAEPVPGVLVVAGSTATWQRQLTIALLGASEVGVAGFRTAAALHGFDGYPHGPVELIVPTWRRQLAPLATLHVVALADSDVTTVAGFRCTGIARTLCDIASVDPSDLVASAFESMWRCGVSLRWLRQTAERLHRPGQRGTKVLLRLLDEAARHERPTGSRLELELADVLHGIGGLVRQHSIYTATGTFVARPDLAVPVVRLALEAHSRAFHFGPVAVGHDEDREHQMTCEGWQTLYFGKASMRSPSRVRQHVITTIERRRRDLAI